MMHTAECVDRVILWFLFRVIKPFKLVIQQANNDKENVNE